MSGIKIGLIVNPVAGIGGRAGLKGSDGLEIQQKARELGVEAQAGLRTVMALEELADARDKLTLLTAPGEMGELPARQAGLVPQVVGEISYGRTTAADTVSIARLMERMGVRLLVFSGGDGTARNIFEALEMRVPALGIPAGVKIHSAVYAINPRGAGKVLRQFVLGETLNFREAEVMDINEEAFRSGSVQARLYGYLKAPESRRLMQSAKSGGYSERAALAGMAQEIIENMAPDDLYIIGSGTTTREIMTILGQPNTLLGVDVLLNRRVIASDVNEGQLFRMIQGKKSHLVLTAIGGQGHIFGRGNQQLSPRVIRQVGKDHLIIMADKGKLVSLHGAPMLADTGDSALDRELCGYYRVITGYEDYIPYKVET